MVVYDRASTWGEIATAAMLSGDAEVDAVGEWDSDLRGGCRDGKPLM